MQICPTNDYKQKSVFEWSIFDYIHALKNEADRKEFNGEFAESKALNAFADTLINRVKKRTWILRALKSPFLFLIATSPRTIMRRRNPNQ